MKNKILKVLGGAVLSIAMVFSFASVSKAFTPVLSIEQLPEYTNTDTFNISYSVLVNSGVSAQFAVRKDTDSTWRNFGGVLLDASGEVEVMGSQIYDNDGLYRFRVTVTYSGGSISAETNTRIDRSGPSPVSNYSKEQVAPGFYRISWTTPHDSDFANVFVYRSDKPDFDANGSTKVYTLGGPPETNESWDNVGLDSNKTYYYALIAVDKAGNPSSVVGDNVTTVYITPSPTIPGGSVVQLPEEEGEGSVLGTGEEATPEATPTETPAPNVIQKVATFARERTKITVGIIALIILLLYYLYKKYNSRYITEIERTPEKPVSKPTSKKK